jgi:hypothetical protein
MIQPLAGADSLGAMNCSGVEQEVEMTRKKKVQVRNTRQADVWVEQDKNVDEGNDGKETVGTCNEDCSMRSNTAPVMVEVQDGERPLPRRTEELHEDDSTVVERGDTVERN